MQYIQYIYYSDFYYYNCLMIDVSLVSIISCEEVFPTDVRGLKPQIHLFSERK